MKVSKLYKQEYEIQPRITIYFDSQTYVSGTLESVLKAIPGIYEIRIEKVPWPIELSGDAQPTIRWPDHPWIEKGLTEEEYRVQYPTHEPPGFSY